MCLSFARREGRSNEKTSSSFDAGQACPFAPLRQGCYSTLAINLAAGLSIEDYKVVLMMMYTIQDQVLL
jgi:hypothetical protein